MADLVIDYDVHLHAGRVWRCQVEVPCAHSPAEITNYVNLTVEVIAPDQNLAQYIAMCLYPDYSSLSIEDEPIKPGTSEDIPTQTT
tara:strand:- start:115 stop:372 length:258 start_codon:yes stop_codon:yes gene_type:complete